MQKPPLIQTGKVIPMAEFVRKQGGLVNEINPPRPQPKKKKTTGRTTAGRSNNAGKILRSQR